MPAMNTPGVKALAIWDVLISQITTVGSIGEILKTLTFTDYYADPGVAAGTIMLPPARTIVMVTHLTENAKLQVTLAGGVVKDVPSANEGGFIGAVYCDGSLSGFKNTDVGNKTLRLIGLTLG